MRFIACCGATDALTPSPGKKKENSNDAVGALAAIGCKQGHATQRTQPPRKLLDWDGRYSWDKLEQGQRLMQHQPASHSKSHCLTRSSMPNHPLAPAQPDPHQRHHPTQDSPHTAPDLPLIPAHCSLRDHSEDLPVCCDTADTIRGTLASFSCCLEGDQKGRSPGGCCTLLHTSGRLGRQRSSSSGMLSSYCPSPCTSPRPSRLLHHAPGQHADGEVLSNKCRVSAGPERDDVWVRSQLSRDLHQDNSEEMSCAHAERGSPTLPAVSCSHGGGPDIHGTPASLEWRSSGMGFAEIMKIGTSTLESKGCSRNKQQEWEDQRWKEGIQHWGLKGGDQDLEQGEAGQGMAGPEGECSLREHHGAGVNEAPLLTLQTSGQILPSQGSGDLRTQSLLLGEQSTGMDCPRPPPDADQPRSLSFQSTNLDSYASPHISARTSRDVPTGLPSMPGEVVAVVSPVLLQPQQPKQQHPEQQSEQQQPLQITALLPGDFNPGCQDLPCNPKPTSPGEGPSSGLLTSAGTDSSGANSSGIAVQDCPPVALDAGLKSGGVAVPDPPGSSTQPLRKLPLPLLQHSPRTALSVRIPYCSPFAVPDVPWASDSGNEGIGDGGCGSSSCSNREYILPTFQSPGGGSPTRSMTSTMGGSPTRSIMSIMGGTPTRSMMSTMGGSPTMSMMSPMGSSPPMTLMSPRGGSPMRTMSEQHSADIVGLLPQMQHLMDPLEVTSTRLIGRGSYGSVYLGTWKGKPAAIKVIPMKPLHWEPPSQHKSAASKLQQQEQSMQNIEEEAVLCICLRHPNVISTYTAFIESRHKLPGVPNNGKSNTTPDLATLSTTDEQCRTVSSPGDLDQTSSASIVMEYCEGGSLRSALDKGSTDIKGNLNEVLPLACEICSAMAYLHEQGITHGDLKAANIMLALLPESIAAKVGRRYCSKVADFGHSRIMELADIPESSHPTHSARAVGALSPGRGASQPPSSTHLTIGTNSGSQLSHSESIPTVAMPSSPGAGSSLAPSAALPILDFPELASAFDYRKSNAGSTQAVADTTQFPTSTRDIPPPSQSATTPGLHAATAPQLRVKQQSVPTPPKDKVISQQTGRCTKGGDLGTPSHMAPELVANGEKGPGTESDVYALGVVLWELYTGLRPYHRMKCMDLMRSKITQPTSHVLLFPLHCPPKLVLLCQSCWAEPQQRPTMATLLTQLNCLCQELAPGRAVSLPDTDLDAAWTSLKREHLHTAPAMPPSEVPARHAAVPPGTHSTACDAKANPGYSANPKDKQHTADCGEEQVVPLSQCSQAARCRAASDPYSGGTASHTSVAGLEAAAMHLEQHQPPLPTPGAWRAKALSNPLLAMPGSLPASPLAPTPPADASTDACTMQQVTRAAAVDPAGEGTGDHAAVGPHVDSSISSCAPPTATAAIEKAPAQQHGGMAMHGGHAGTTSSRQPGKAVHAPQGTSSCHTLQGGAEAGWLPPRGCSNSRRSSITRGGLLEGLRTGLRRVTSSSSLRSILQPRSQHKLPSAPSTTRHANLLHALPHANHTSPSSSKHARPHCRSADPSLHAAHTANFIPVARTVHPLTTPAPLPFAPPSLFQPSHGFKRGKACSGPFHTPASHPPIHTHESSVPQHSSAMPPPAAAAAAAAAMATKAPCSNAPLNAPHSRTKKALFQSPPKQGHQTAPSPPPALPTELSQASARLSIEQQLHNVSTEDMAYPGTPSPCAPWRPCFTDAHVPLSPTKHTPGAAGGAVAAVAATQTNPAPPGAAAAAAAHGPSACTPLSSTVHAQHTQQHQQASSSMSSPPHPSTPLPPISQAKHHRSLSTRASSGYPAGTAAPIHSPHVHSAFLSPGAHVAPPPRSRSYRLARSGSDYVPSTALIQQILAGSSDSSTWFPPSVPLSSPAAFCQQQQQQQQLLQQVHCCEQLHQDSVGDGHQVLHACPSHDAKQQLPTWMSAPGGSVGGMAQGGAADLTLQGGHTTAAAPAGSHACVTEWGVKPIRTSQPRSMLSSTSQQCFKPADAMAGSGLAPQVEPGRVADPSNPKPDMEAEQQRPQQYPGRPTRTISVGAQAQLALACGVVPHFATFDQGVPDETVLQFLDELSPIASCNEPFKVVPLSPIQEWKA